MRLLEDVALQCVASKHVENVSMTALAAAEQRLMDAKMLEDERLDFDHREGQAATKACKVSCVRFIALGFPVLGFPVSGFPSIVHAFSI